MKIESIETIIVDIPLIRPHKLSFVAIDKMSSVIVRIRTDRGVTGLGEATAIGGPSWAAESVETMKAVIDLYLAPALIGTDPRSFATYLQVAHRVRNNEFAKSALEMALHDVAARAQDIPVHALLGGAVRDRIACAWGVATGDAEADIAEAKRLKDAGSYSVFKVKIGRDDPGADVARIGRMCAALGQEAEVRVDVNQAWDLRTARKWVPALDNAGCALIEQPIRATDTRGLVSLQDKCRVPVMADESVMTEHDLLELIRLGGVDALAIKVAKCGGLRPARRMAEMAICAGMSPYGGTMLEGVIGTAASLHLFCAVEQMPLGCELFGPDLAADRITTSGLRMQDGARLLNDGPGLGVEIDEAKLARYRRPETSARTAA
ncbi:muconate/chloromuconate family cycloisomerase [Salipiger sp. P9]|uniref:muconate/chloromuconate family cycloisomerase n=1 Tax=Salipiger pentaromativorans TaxID=2943193 RepID=UPI002158166D|nr:muconate/chloromuconate family cycloisomerase [Salipiger pentaromativorans]MCR8551015.1 muconate/chloromuconate family cycloisomerase [Salipiger pentaromativorans]